MLFDVLYIIAYSYKVCISILVTCLSILDSICPGDYLGYGFLELSTVSVGKGATR